MTFHISGGHLCTAFCMSLELSVNGILHQVPRGGRVEDLTLGSSPTLMKGIHIQMGFPGGSDGKASACNAGDLGLIPGLGRPPGEGNGNPLQYSCLEKSMDGGVWLCFYLAERTRELCGVFYIRKLIPFMRALTS